MDGGMTDTTVLHTGRKKRYTKSWGWAKAKSFRPVDETSTHREPRLPSLPSA